MKVIASAAVLIAVISVVASFSLGKIGKSSAEEYASPSVRLD
ncbi:MULTISPECIES: hypothetical protein [Halocynthiibacter]|uniref:Uncharacterized protein n=1 Tax=Halocynthiibacter halioticoli TaxID=2986804 RepID=A0AAE3IZA3_9RHOB|nr:MULTISPECIES: hypothetical protein [Halocynthiibacter]MCV6825082.1 hypothetical protein [Halocynthiibacter halioticoli]MCW4058083.1 hypothetical protein [Halocynthiibacter sp. SDUM655004]MDE0588884.1 hypothetical protein [Halocynthiibacter sp. C4]